MKNKTGPNAEVDFTAYTPTRVLGRPAKSILDAARKFKGLETDQDPILLIVRSDCLAAPTPGKILIAYPKGAAWPI